MKPPPINRCNRPSIVWDTDSDIAYDLAQVGFPEIHILGISSRKKNAAPSPQPHAHDNLEICNLISGTRTNYVDGELRHLNEGDLWINKPGTLHGSGLIPNGPSTILYLELCPPKAGARWLGLSPTEADAFWQSWLDLPECVVRNDPIYVTIFERVIRLIEAPRTPWVHHRVPAIINAFLFSVYNLLLNAPPQAMHPGIRRALARIHTLTLGAPFPSIADLAQEADLSVSHFKTSFKRDTGTAPAKSILAKRLSLCREALKTTPLSISEIAQQAGFPSSQHFATSFKAYFGQSPTDYRASPQV